MILRQTGGRKKKTNMEHAYEAANSLDKARMQIESNVIPIWTATRMLLDDSGKDNELCDQIDNKISMLQAVMSSMTDAINTISKMESDQIARIKDGVIPMEVKFPLEDNKYAKNTRELYSSGIYQLYEVELIAVKKDFFSGAFYTIMGIGQLAAGIAIAVGSGGFATSFGIGLAADGISDIITGAQALMKGKKLDLSSYGFQKAISFVVNASTAFVSAASAGAKEAAKETAKEGAKAATKETAKETLKDLTKAEVSCQT